MLLCQWEYYWSSLQVTLALLDQEPEWVEAVALIAHFDCTWDTIRMGSSLETDSTKDRILVLPVTELVVAAERVERLD